MTKLYAARFSSSLTDATMLEQFDAPAAIGVRWSLAGHGVERLEVLVRCNGRLDQFDRYRNHLGQRIALYGGSSRPISGIITECEPVGTNQLLYVAKGPAFRMDDAPVTAVFSTANTVNDTISLMVTDHIPTADGSLASIAANTTPLGGYQVRWPQGDTARQIIADMLQISDSDGTIYDFWLVDNPLNGLALQSWRANYQPRAADAAVDWQVDLSDLSELVLSRDINDIVTKATVYYGTISSTATGGSATSLVDAAAAFRTQGVIPGDRVTNVTDGSRGQVVEVVSQTELLLNELLGGTANEFANTDIYSIQLQLPKAAAFDTGTSIYRTREISVSEPQMTETQASNYAKLLIQTEPRQVQSITVSAPSIRDSNGAEWPLWEVVARGGGYIRINDLYPDASLFSTSLNGTTAFRITSLDYDNVSQSLRIGLDALDSRLDARLQRAGIMSSPIIYRDKKESQVNQSSIGVGGRHSL